MKCIITAGPTYEELDEVRRLTNFSTGALGTELAKHLVDSGHEVILLRGQCATCRLEPKAGRVEEFTTTADLGRRLEALAAADVGAVFHAAAVSDFAFGKIFRRDAQGKLTEIKSRKIATRDGALLAELVPTPKLIGRLRGWFPKGRLVGWKYELDGDRDRLVSLAETQLRENQTDACVINGAAYGQGFGLVQPGRARHCADKSALFTALDVWLTER